MLLHAGHRSLIEPLDHCAMHARRPADLTVSGPFQIVPAMEAYLFGRGYR